MARVVEGDLVRRAGAALDAVDEEAAADLVRIAQQVVVDGDARRRRRALDGDRHAEAERRVHREMHLLHALLDGVEALMVRRRGERRLRHAADGLDVLRDFRLRQEAAVARFRALADLDEHAARIRDHVRHRLDDAVPAEMTGGDLDDEVFEILRLEELHGHAALARTHAHGQAAFLVEIADRERDGLPGARRERADGHVGEDERIDPLHGRRAVLLHELAVHDLERQLMRVEHAAERRADVERMARRIKRRVRHLRDAADDDGVECALRVEVRAAAALQRAVVLREQMTALVGVAHGMDGIVRADFLAHPAAAAEVREARDLLDDGARDMRMLRRRHARLGDRDRLLLHHDLDGVK